jgi:DNA-binding NarL/FixJ family response regulator
LTAKIRVLLVDDHVVFLEGLSALLSDYTDLEVVGRVRSVADAIRAAEDVKPDVVLMDYRLPDGTGAAAAAGIRELRPEATIVFLSGDESEESLMASVEAGAVGYLIKSESAGEIAAALRKAALGDVLLPAGVLTQLIDRQQRLAARLRTSRALVEQLSARELEVLRLMAEGLDNLGIADRLGVKYTTIRTHVRNVLAKLEVHSKLQAVARASGYGLLD